MSHAYLIRYGVGRSVARFAIDPDGPEDLRTNPLDRGQMVVIRTHRGTELGEVLGAAPAGFDADTPTTRVAPLLRVASNADLMLAQQATSRRASHFDLCQAVFNEGIWPLELVDAEPLLDTDRTVLHYLGPHRLDASGLVAIFRDRCGLDIVLEPVGRDVSDDDLNPEPEVEPESAGDDHGCGSCGSKSGGCGSCGSAGGGCAIKALVGKRSKREAKQEIFP